VLLPPPELPLDELPDDEPEFPEEVGNVTTGTSFTTTVTLCDRLPPAPVQERAKVFVPIVVGVVTSLPLVAFVPVHSPLAVHAVAFVVLQVSVADVPRVMVLVEVVRVTVGAGVGAGAGAGGVVSSSPIRTYAPFVSAREPATGLKSVIFKPIPAESGTPW
jgi:hypothetical protein